MKAIKYALIGLFGIIGVVLSVFGIKVPFAESLAKEHWRAGLAALLLIILLTPAAFGLFLYLFDANRFKSEIIHYVKEYTQRDLVLQGDIKVTFFPKLGLDSGRMSLSQRNSAKEFASVNNARLYIAWLPLLKKQLVFDHIEIDGASANLIRFKDGTTNFDDLLIRDETLSPVTFDIDSVRITHSSLNLQDEIKWKRVALQDIQIETGRLADDVPGNLSASFHLNSEKIHSDSRIELKSRLLYDLKAKRYEFADIEGKLEGTVAEFSNLAMNFRGSLESQQAQESLSIENLLVSGTGNFGQRGIEGKADIHSLKLAKGVLSGSQFTLDATVSQFDEKWTTTVLMPSFEYANQIFNASEFGVDFNFQNSASLLQGKLSGPLAVNFETKPKLQISAVAMDISVRHPALSDELHATATGALNADFAVQNASLDLGAKIGDSEIAGKVALTDFSHPAYTFDLQVNRIDLDRYVSSDWIRRYQNNTTQIDLGGIKNLTLIGHLRADEFRAAKLKVTKLSADIKIEQSTLTIAPIEAKLYGGTLTGSISLMAQAMPQILLKNNLKGIQVNALLADTSVSGKVSGKGDISIDVSAEGDSVGALRKTLDGSFSLALTRGFLAGVDMRMALIEGKDDLGGNSEPRVHESRFSERTDFLELKSAINFKDGGSHGNYFEMKSPLFTIAGEGERDMDSGNINYQLATVVSSTLNRRSAGELAELKGVTVPVHVYGQWAAPSMALNFSAASGDIVNKRIAAKIAAEQAAAKIAEQAIAKAAVQVAATKGATAPTLKKQTVNTNKK